MSAQGSLFRGMVCEGNLGDLALGDLIASVKQHGAGMQRYFYENGQRRIAAKDQADRKPITRRAYRCAGCQLNTKNDWRALWFENAALRRSSLTPYLLLRIMLARHILAVLDRISVWCFIFSFSLLRVGVSQVSLSLFQPSKR